MKYESVVITLCWAERVAVALRLEALESRPTHELLRLEIQLFPCHGHKHQHLFLTCAHSCVSDTNHLTAGRYQFIPVNVLIFTCSPAWTQPHFIIKWMEQVCLDQSLYSRWNDSSWLRWFKMKDNSSVFHHKYSLVFRC